jgi:hypothetical protein
VSGDVVSIDQRPVLYSWLSNNVEKPRNKMRPPSTEHSGLKWSEQNRLVGPCHIVSTMSVHLFGQHWYPCLMNDYQDVPGHLAQKSSPTRARRAVLTSSLARAHTTSEHMTERLCDQPWPTTVRRRDGCHSFLFNLDAAFHSCSGRALNPMKATAR